MCIHTPVYTDMRIYMYACVILCTSMHHAWYEDLKEQRHGFPGTDEIPVPEASLGLLFLLLLEYSHREPSKILMLFYYRSKGITGSSCGRFGLEPWKQSWSGKLELRLPQPGEPRSLSPRYPNTEDLYSFIWNRNSGLGYILHIWVRSAQS